MVLQGPSEGPESNIQVEQPDIPVPMLFRETSMTQAEPSTHVLDNSDGPVQEGIRDVLKLQHRALDNQVHCVLPPQRLAEGERVPFYLFKC